MWFKTRAKEPSTPDNQTATPQTSNPTVSANPETFREAASQGLTQKVLELVKKGVDVNIPDQEGRTALMLAAFDGHTQIVRFLLDNKAYVDTRDGMGRTALMYAASGPNPETVQLLLERRADPNLVDQDEKFTALMFAAAEGQTRVVEILLKHGADASLLDADGETALDFAQNNGHTEVARLLKTKHP